jgi:hypothetical protein
VEGNLGQFFERPPVVLLASLPTESEGGAGIDRALAIQEAVLSFARAAYSHGHAVAAPADGFVAPLLAAVATEYQAPARSEAVDARPIQLAVGSWRGEEEEGGRWSRRPAPDGVMRGTFEGFDHFLAWADPRQVIVVGGGHDEPEAEPMERFIRMRDRGVGVHAIGPTLTDAALGHGWGAWDVTRNLLDEIEWPRRASDRDDDSPPLGAEAVVPYAYLMQRLLSTDEDEGTPEPVGGGFDQR